MASKTAPILTFASILGCVGTLFFSHTHLLFFAPYLVLVFYKRSRFVSLWCAIGCGLVIDLLSSSPHFGLTALNYTLASWILYGQTLNFFEDKVFTLPLMTAFFAILSTIISVTIAFFFAEPIHLSLHWLLTDLIAMPLFDALYALAIALPFQITHQLRKLIRARRRAK